MAQVIELLDGNLITPMGIFDVLDVVEEYMGTEIRQYIEAWFEDGQEELTEDERFDALRDHYLQVMMNVGDEVEVMLTRKQKKEEQRESLLRIKNMIRRECRGKEAV